MRSGGALAPPSAALAAATGKRTYERARRVVRYPCGHVQPVGGLVPPSRGRPRARTACAVGRPPRVGVFRRAASGGKGPEGGARRPRQEAWGHSVTELLDALKPQESAIDDAMLDRGRALDKLYVAARCPSWLPAGAPADYYTRAEAERALTDADSVIDWCRGALPR